MNRIYLDYAATTPLDPEVFESMKPYFTGEFYNPSGVYEGAVRVKDKLEEAREKIARAVSARSQEIVFYDGGTEANNQALVGAINAWKTKNPTKKPHIITSTIEHSSVLEFCKHLEVTKQCDVDYISVNKSGVANLKELKKFINENTVIISIGYANGEVGVIQDIKEVAKIARHYRKHHQTSYPYVHTDAAQATQFCNINVLQLGVDMMTITGSKIYGPKKIAALFIKTGVELQPLLYGGEQEQTLRPGTENIPYIIGLAQALTKARNLSEEESARIAYLRDFFIKKLRNDSSIIINSNHEGVEYLPNIVNITVPDLSSEEIVIRFDAKGIDCSMKSACKSDADGDSHVIVAMRAEDAPNKDYTGSIRFSFGRGTTQQQLETTIHELTSIISSMRNFNQSLIKN